MTEDTIRNLRRQFTGFTEQELISTADALGRQIAGDDPDIDATDPATASALKRIRALILDEQARRRSTTVIRSARI